jgi:GDPmannose 4,6-dehydratase
MHSVKQFVEMAFGHAGLDWEKHIVIDPRFVRPAEVDHLLGDSTRAHEKLGWKPEVDFQALVKMMVDADLECVAKEIRNGKACGR